MLKSKSLYKLLPLAFLITTSCLKEKQLAGQKATTSSDSTYQGCTTGEALDASRVLVGFSFPDEATQIQIYRNGTLVYTTNIRSDSSYTDMGLMEGATYRYTCQMTDSRSRSIQGLNSLTLTTISTNPPTFTGIKTASASGSSAVAVTWNIPAATGVAAAKYKVYGNPGTSVDWNATPLATITNSSSISSVVPNIGDELSYSFGVRACSATDNCDTNTTTKTVTLADRGAPTTVGVTSAIVQGGKAVLTAPWTHSNGAVAVRYVYSRQGTSGSFALAKTFNVTNVNSPQTTLNLDDVLVGGTDYQFYVIDQDPTGNQNSNSSIIVTVNSGDVVKPVFAGITNLTYGSPTDTVAQLQWTAISRMSDDAVNGASHYLIYLQVMAPSDTASSCTTGVLSKQIDATDTIGSTVTYNLTGLTPRTKYSVCVKARDLANNISDTSAQSIIITRDLTAPIFGGLTGISYNNAQNRVELTWTASGSTDLKEYRIKVFKGSTSSPTSLQTLSMRPYASNVSGANFNATEYTYVDNDIIFVVVDACDDASPTYGTQNCTSFSNASAMSLPIPDITPPTGFGGITGASQVTPTALQDSVVVSWAPPASWTGFRGFLVYALDGSNAIPTDGSGNPIAIKDCACSGNNCPDTPTSCTINGLLAYKNYKFHVRAYDIAGNIAIISPPASSFQSIRTVDTVPPTLNSAVQINSSSPYSNVSPGISWTAATDNQQDSSNIRYTVWRKRGSTFSTPYNPSIDANTIQVVIDTLSTSVQDSNILASGNTYYYMVCAKDISNNSVCDGAGINSKVVADATAPSIGTPLITACPVSGSSIDCNGTGVAKEDIHKVWKLNWTLYDNLTSNSNLQVNVYRAIGATSATTATTNDTLIASQAGLTSLMNLSGPSGNNYISYLIQVTDEAGNASTKTVQVYSKNSGFAITSISRAQGRQDTQKMIVIKGAGFGKGMSVTIGGLACSQSVDQVADETIAYCTTPNVSSNGIPDGTALDVVATNANNLTATLSGGFIYSSLGDTGNNVCDYDFDANSVNGVTANPTSSGFQYGTGTAGNPWVICNITQFNLINSTASSPAKYYKLGDNIDLSSFTTRQNLYGGFNGNNFALIGGSFTSTGSGELGIFHNIIGGGYNRAENIQDVIIIGTSMIYGGTSIADGGILINSCGSALFSPTFSGISIYNASIYSTAGATTTASHIGLVCGQKNSTVYFTMSNITVVNSSINADKFNGGSIGGVIGNPNPYQANTINDVTIKNLSISNATMSVGGVVGYAGWAGSITLNNVKVLGGSITDKSTCTYTTCYSFGGLVGVSAYGQASVGITNSYSSISINAPNTASVGGLIGMVGNANTYDKVYRSAFAGSIIAERNVGGIYGAASWTIDVQDVYVTGTLFAYNGRIGGLSGLTSHNNANKAFRVYVNSTITSAANTSVGAIYGNLNETCTDCFYSYDASSPTLGTTQASRTGAATVTTGQKTITQLQTVDLSNVSRNPYTNWDFLSGVGDGSNEYWKVNSSLNNGMPILNGVTPE